MDRLTNESYDIFYKEEIYRKLIYEYKYHGRAISSKSRFKQQIQYAAKLLGSIDGIVDIREGLTLLDIGGSEGGVSMEFKKRYAVDATVIDPSLQELKVAESVGLKGVNSNFETWETDEKYDLILLCRTVEHLYDLKFVLEKIGTMLKPGGTFFMDFLDFNCECRRYGPPQNVSRIDHCFWLTSRTAEKILPYLGFKIKAKLYNLGSGNLGLLLEKGEKKPIAEISQIEDSLIYYQKLNDEWVISNLPGSWIGSWKYKMKKKIRRFIH
ncbi:MAG: class I SAM-dependent methyltransferase [FCB group bacterium]|nr:class I SAM-dependent methyltransferase [FCB group bacterium]